MTVWQQQWRLLMAAIAVVVNGGGGGIELTAPMAASSTVAAIDGGGDNGVFTNACHNNVGEQETHKESAYEYARYCKTNEAQQYSKGKQVTFDLPLDVKERTSLDVHQPAPIPGIQGSKTTEKNPRCSMGERVHTPSHF